MEFKEFNINSPIIAHIKNLESQIKDKDKRAGVLLENSYGGNRYLEPPKGELLPRIC